MLSWEFDNGVPGLSLVLRLCHTLRYWLAADPAHVAVLLANELEDTARCVCVCVCVCARARARTDGRTDGQTDRQRKTDKRQSGTETER